MTQVQCGPEAQLLDHSEVAQQHEISNCSEPSNDDSWLGFAAALNMSAMEFSRIILENNSLWYYVAKPSPSTVPDAHKNLLTRDRKFIEVAHEYVEEYTKILDLHAVNLYEDSSISHYRYPKDITSSDLIDDNTRMSHVLAFDFGAFLAINHINMAHYYKLLGNDSAAAVYRGRAEKYARYFRNQMWWNTTTNGLNWNFSNYYERADDIGHANANEIHGIAKTYEKLMYENGDIGAGLIDGSLDKSFRFMSDTKFFHSVACISSETLRPRITRKTNYLGSSLYDVMQIAH